ncbi:hypothetical protein ACFXC8_34550 [Streptomyces sp. NPDC059441]|uniref:hypothetical protein n=1 Tax=Streptomyces sp. NPDC059441 TaxID=3346829 RepID=UPI0036C208C9
MGNCYAAGKRRRPVPRDEARRLLTSGVRAPALPHLRDDRALPVVLEAGRAGARVRGADRAARQRHRLLRHCPLRGRLPAARLLLRGLRLLDRLALRLAGPLLRLPAACRLGGLLCRGLSHGRIVEPPRRIRPRTMRTGRARLAVRD